jgi:hypothetical protein
VLGSFFYIGCVAHLVPQPLVALQLVVEDGERRARLLGAVEQEADVAALPAHVVEVDQRGVEADARAALVDAADVAGQDARHQRHCGFIHSLAVLSTVFTTGPVPLVCSIQGSLQSIV